MKRAQEDVEARSREVESEAILKERAEEEARRAAQDALYFKWRDDWEKYRKQRATILFDRAKEDAREVRSASYSSIIFITVPARLSS